MKLLKCIYDCCPVISTESDDIAVHLIDRHGWDYDNARAWLRMEVEEESFGQQP